MATACPSDVDAASRAARRRTVHRARGRRLRVRRAHAGRRHQRPAGARPGARAGRRSPGRRRPAATSRRWRRSCRATRSEPGWSTRGSMELGQTVCTARAPRCDECPLIAAPVPGGPPDTPSTRARERRVQKKYEGSDRQVRGLILRELRAADVPVPAEPRSPGCGRMPTSSSGRSAGLLRDGLAEPVDACELRPPLRRTLTPCPPHSSSPARMPTTSRAALAALPGSARDRPASSRPRCWPKRTPPRRSPRLPDLDRTDIEFVTIDPGRLDRPRPGAAARARGRRIPLLVCDRRPDRLRRTRRRAGCRGAPPRTDAVRRRRPHPAASTGAQRGRRLAAPGRTTSGVRLGLRSGCERRRHRPPARPRDGPQPPPPDYRGRQDELDRGRHRRVARRCLRRSGRSASARSGSAAAPIWAHPRSTSTRTRPVPSLTVAPVLPLEDWNAQISLLTGMDAAQLMLDGQVGILRTMPPADPDCDRALPPADRRPRAPVDPGAALWRYLAELRGPTRMIWRSCTRRLRCSAAPGTPRSTGPLLRPPCKPLSAPRTRTSPRRCGGSSIASGSRSAPPCRPARRVPDWARTALPDLPRTMAASGTSPGSSTGSPLDAVEAAILAPRVGEDFDAVVLGSSGTSSTVQLLDPAVRPPARRRSRPEARCGCG